MTSRRSLNILDRFHIVAKMNLALDEVRAAFRAASTPCSAAARQR